MQPDILMSVLQDFTDKPDLPENHTTFRARVLYYGCDLHPALSAAVTHVIDHLKWMILDKISQEQDLFR